MANVDNTISAKFIPELVYQPLELITEYEVKLINGTHYNKLHSVNGMRPYYPDKQIKDSCLLDMIKLNGKVEFLMVVTMYNEDRQNFTDTMHGIMENLKHFQEDGLDPSLVGCIIIVDGIRPFSQTFHKPDQNPYFSNFFNEAQIRERFNIQDTINGIPLLENQEIAHCFSCRTNFAFEGYPELQLVFCVKQKNKRKLNTHLWFFGGFCKMIEPKFVMLIDVGTKPFSKSLCALYDTMKMNDMIAGVCGEIAPMDPQFANIIVSGQAVEYTFSHIFDKALESCFGYIGVLPGAFSAYRWEAINGPPLEVDYFTTMTRPEIMNAYYSNIFLAEDRVLSLAIVSRPGTTYLLKFVHLAYAETDVPEKIFVLLSQRRRWINGSWFALIETWRNFGRIGQSNHSRWRKFWICIELVYFTATIFVSWVMVGSFYLFCELIFGSLLNQYSSSFLKYFSMIELVMSLYLGILMVIFMLSFGVKTAKVEITYKILAFLLAVYMILSFIILNYSTFSGASQLSPYTIFLLCGVMGSYGVGIVLTKNLKKVLFRTVQFLIITPIYVNFFGIYAVCNIHDCSWGNRPEVMTEEELMKVTDFQHYRTKWVIIWIVSNILYYKLVNASLVDPNQTALTIIFTLAVILILFRFFGCIWHYFTWWLDNKGSGTKRYIALSSAALIEVENKKLLNELNEKLNQSMMMGSSKMLRNSMLGKSMMGKSMMNKSMMGGGNKKLRESLLGIIEKKGKEKLGKNFHLNLTKMIKMNEIMESDPEDEEEGENSFNSEEPFKSESEKSIEEVKKKKKKGKKKKGLKGTTVILKKCDLEESKESVKEEVMTKKYEIKIDQTKNFLNDPDVSIISRGQCSGKFEFEIDDSNVRNVLGSQMGDITIKGELDFQKSEQKDFVWEDSEDVENIVNEIQEKPEKVQEGSVIGSSESSGIETDNTEDAEKYLDMLDSIIRSVSLTNTFN